MIPTAPNGDKFPALAPLAIINAARNGEMPARMLRAMPTGATRATATMAPRPTVEIAQAIRKTIGGTSVWRPRARPSSRRANLSLESSYQCVSAYSRTLMPV